MHELSWQEHILPLPDHNLAWYELGSGPTVLCLSGGPGDDHAYLRPVVEPLASQFRWILYDQRGAGRSVLEQLDEVTLQVDRLVEDLEALRRHLGQDRMRLVGHSWGANLALLYSATYPDHVDRVALVGLGPLDDELSAVASANLMKPLTPAERQEHARLSELLKRAVQENDRNRMAGLDAQRLPLFARGAFYSPEKAMQFVDDYLAADSHRKLNRRVNRFVSASYRKISIWDRLDRVSAAVLVLYGYQDFEPISQAYLIRERIPRTRICFLNQCGHEPWLEQPDAFYRALEQFLAGSV
ncbi:MAG: alpha/beta hydrolase [Chloroflexota bacterium]|nr:alpha/beta hydrolase [Chloroflexota bacterium]